MKKMLVGLMIEVEGDLPDWVIEEEIMSSIPEHVNRNETWIGKMKAIDATVMTREWERREK